MIRKTTNHLILDIQYFKIYFITSGNIHSFVVLGSLWLYLIHNPINHFDKHFKIYFKV